MKSLNLVRDLCVARFDELQEKHGTGWISDGGSPRLQQAACGYEDLEDFRLRAVLSAGAHRAIA